VTDAAARSPAETTLTVAELHSRVATAVTGAFPAPVWVRGEVSGLRRTSRGAVFFRLVDPGGSGEVVEVSARGRVMYDIDRTLDSAGVGSMRDGIEVRIRAVVGVDPSRSIIRLTLLGVDPEFIAGRLALDRQQVLARLAADGSLHANRRHPIPLVPLQIGLVTSRGSAAHADFIDHLRRSGYRFRVRTVHAATQGDTAAASVARALRRLAVEALDVAVVVRGGGSRLDLLPFDSEEVARAVAEMPVPVIVGIGHETDRCVVDEVAAVSVKTPTAAAEWLVARVGDYAGRIETARRLIREEARAVCTRAQRQLDHSAAVLGTARASLARQAEMLAELRSSIADEARRALHQHRQVLDGMEEMLDALGVESTLRRGFAIVTAVDGRVIRSAREVAPGQRLRVRFADGSVRVEVEGDA
jgi:exodeoxyribonuclease VII large subunit